MAALPSAALLAIALHAGTSACRTSAPSPTRAAVSTEVAAASRPGSPTPNSSPTPSTAVPDGITNFAGRDAGQALCTDAGPPHVSVNLRVVTRPVKLVANERCTSRDLVLEIPQLAIEETICISGCAPFGYDSTVVEPNRSATYVCRTDLQNERGEVRVTADSVLELSAQDWAPGRDWTLGVLPQNPVPREPHKRYLRFPLPCGSSVSFKASGHVSDWPE